MQHNYRVEQAFIHQGRSVEAGETLALTHAQALFLQSAGIITAISPEPPSPAVGRVSTKATTAQNQQRTQS